MAAALGVVGENHAAIALDSQGLGRVGSARPLPAIEIAQRRAAPFRVELSAVGINAHVHDGGAARLDLADLAQGDLIREAGQVITLGRQMAKGRVGGPRQKEKEPGSHRQHAKSDESDEASQSGTKGAAGPACDLPGALLDGLNGAADLRTGQCGDREEQKQTQEQEEIQLNRKQRGGEQLQKRDDGGVEVIPIGFGGENSEDGDKEDQMDRSLEKVAG